MTNTSLILSKKRRERTQTHAVKTEKGEITTDPAEIQIISTHFENLYANRMENTEEKDRFLGTYQLPTPNEQDRQILKKTQYPATEIEEVMKNPPPKRSPGPDGCTAECGPVGGSTDGLSSRASRLVLEAEAGGEKAAAGPRPSPFPWPLLDPAGASGDRRSSPTT